MGLDCVELVVLWEKAFSISIPNELAAMLTTPRLAADAIEEILVRQGRAMDRKTIEETIKTCTLEVSGLDSSSYDPSLEFVRDMGMD